jgi:hypothetical protein
VLVLLAKESRFLDGPLCFVESAADFVRSSRLDPRVASIQWAAERSIRSSSLDGLEVLEKRGTNTASIWTGRQQELSNSLDQANAAVRRTLKGRPVRWSTSKGWIGIIACSKDGHPMIFGGVFDWLAKLIPHN